MDGISIKIKNYIDRFVQEKKDTDIVDLDFFSECKGKIFSLCLDVYEKTVIYASEKNMNVALIIPLSQSRDIKNAFTEKDICINRYNLPGFLFYRKTNKFPEDMGFLGIIQKTENSLSSIPDIKNLHVIYQQIPDVDCVYRYLYFYQL